jgi:hypothetical protein
MFAMLGLTIERKKEKLMSAYEEKLNRMLNKQSVKQKAIQREQYKAEAIKAYSMLEQEVSGGFLKLYPLDLESLQLTY